ncbi:MAG: hypothetical protein NT115_00040 [Proteobacteria bacterium]|nr:hypothetical protein [Pseudomonadota bacterium]
MVLSDAAVADGAGLSRFFDRHAGGFGGGSRGGKKKDRPGLSFLSNAGR